MSKKHFNFVRANKLFSRLLIGLTVLFLSVVWLLPAFSGVADAAQLTSRSLTLGDGQAATSSTWTYTFTPSNLAIQSIKFVACTTAVATYGLASVNTLPANCQTTGIPTGININNASTVDTVPSGWTTATVFTRSATGASNCNPTTSGASNNILCASRTAATAESAASKTMTWSLSLSPSTANTAFYIGVYLYSDTAWATPTDSGTVAAAVVNTLQVNAAVAEVLNFCIGSTSQDNATVSPGADCTTISGTSVNLGTLDSGHINITPVVTNCSAADCNLNGIAMVRSNALNGTTVSYSTILGTGTNHTGTLRVSGATCAADTVNASTDTTDQCFNQRPAQATFTAGTERFGMTVAGVNCGSTTSYTCTFSSGTYNLQRDAAYDGTGSNTYNTTDKDQITGTSSNGYAWDETNTSFVPLATSTASTTKVIDDEALILKFAATPSITTPFGSYSVKAEFLAVATY